uniref:non-specific serine/threonine protein kinase n=1 Tax=Caenorhabditis japonica TaxID=281687 RepID=A0A8R1I6N4_CAEJA
MSKDDSKRGEANVNNENASEKWFANSTRARSTYTIEPSEKTRKKEIDNSRKSTTCCSDEIASKSPKKPEPAIKSPVKKKGVLPRPKRPSGETTTLLPIDEKFRSRWHIEGLIGKGGYGEIYLAIDMLWAEQVAIKAEPKERRGCVARRMILEQEVLLRMQGKPHVPMMFGSGHTEKLNFIVLQLLSINLGEIRRLSPTRRLSKSSVGRIIVQAIAALRDLHEIGYLHRDVKPGNMCFGITPKNRHVLMLLDFGLVRRFKNTDGEWRAPRLRAGFRGTQRYVSMRVHKRLEQTPTDDITSLLYSAIELIAGELPWKDLEKSDDILKIKEAVVSDRIVFHINNFIFLMFQHYGHVEMLHQSARDLFGFVKIVSGLEPNSELPYAILQTHVRKLYAPKRLSDPYDWEEEFKQASCEKTVSTDESNREFLEQ